MPRPTKAPSKGRSDDDKPQIVVESQGQLRAWLLEHHADSTGVWVVTTKRAAGGTVTWTDIVEEALCFGWIDSLPRALDETRTMLRLTPRRAASGWSARNKGLVEGLLRQGLMHASGIAAVDAWRRRGAPGRCSTPRAPWSSPTTSRPRWPMRPRPAPTSTPFRPRRDGESSNG